MRRSRAGAALALLGLVPAGCLNGPTEARGPDDGVRVFYDGEILEDSIGARVSGVVFRIVEPDTEDVPVPNVRVLFVAAGENCGGPLEPLIISDEDGYVGNVWVLGTEAGTCRMDVRAVNGSGIQLGVSSTEAEVLPGQAELILALEPGESAEGLGSLALTGAEDAAFDRIGNEVAWRFRVISGPLSVVGGDFGSDGARTLIPSGGTGAGEVAFDTRWGEAARAAACVTADDQGTRIRISRPGPGVEVPPCGG